MVPKADGTMPDYKNQSLYEGWKVIRVGTDAADDFCSKKHVAALTTSETATADIVRTVTVKVSPSSILSSSVKSLACGRPR